MTISTLKYPTDRSSPAFFKAAGTVSRSRVTLPDMSRAVIKNFMDFSVVETPSLTPALTASRPVAHRFASTRELHQSVMTTVLIPQKSSVIRKAGSLGRDHSRTSGKPSLCAALRQCFYLPGRAACDRLASQGRGGDNALHDPRFQRRTPDADTAPETSGGGFESSHPEKCRLGGPHHEPAWR